MNPPTGTPPPLRNAVPAPAPGKALRRLFLTLFLRGRSARGLRKDGAPKSLGNKLALTLFFYFAFGFFALAFLHQTVFALSVYLHAMTFVFLGMFVAASAGEVLFNKEEGDILLHRPVTPRALLWAKIGVLVQVSLWLAGAFNLVGFFAGLEASDGGWLFPLAHVISTALEALFCTGCVVLVYQLCLRWFGRERLDGLMTMAQVVIAVAAVLTGQILPRVIFRYNHVVAIDAHRWWIGFLPPAWFAGFDDALAGSGAGASWLLAAAGLIITTAVIWLAFGKLAGDYATGLQTLSEALPARPKNRARRRWLHAFVNLPLMRWWLRDSVARASFLLCAAYLLRDRDVKLRVYPGLAPMLVLPFVFLFQDHGLKETGGFGGFGVAFMGAYMGVIPMLGLNLLQYSQQWQAADLFRVAPIPGPAPVCQGARQVVLLFLTLPLVVIMGVCAWLMQSDASRLLLLLPGIIAVPVYALIPCLNGGAVPLSQPTEEAKSAGRGLAMVGAMMISAMLAGLAVLSWSNGLFKWLLLIEIVIVTTLYVGMRASLATVRWPAE